MQHIETANLLAIRGNTILLVKRSDDQEEGGLWSLPGGTKRNGEVITDTLLREIKEELGVSVLTYDLFKKYASGSSEKPVDAYYFIGSIDGGDICIDETELSAYKWFSFDELPKGLAYSQNNVIADFLQLESENF